MLGLIAAIEMDLAELHDEKPCSYLNRVVLILQLEL